MNSDNIVMLKDYYYFYFLESYFNFTYNNVLSLGSVLSVSAEYFLATSILSLALFFVLLPKVKLKHFNTEIKASSFISSQLNFLSILILVIYCFLLLKQNFIILSNITVFSNSIFNDYTTLFAKLIIGFSSIIYLLFIQTYLVDQKLYYFEYYLLILTSILGFCLLCCSNDLLTAYLAIELQGLSFYVLASFKKTSNYSAESGVKYFVIGSFSTIIFLLGISLIYGVSGTIFLTDFKDLFLWVFSTNSFFLSFESLLKGIGFFEVENDRFFYVNSRFFRTIKLVCYKFLLFKNQINFALSDTDIRMFDDCSYSKDFVNSSNDVLDIACLVTRLIEEEVERIIDITFIFDEFDPLFFDNLVDCYIYDLLNVHRYTTIPAFFTVPDYNIVAEVSNYNIFTEDLSSKNFYSIVDYNSESESSYPHHKNFSLPTFLDIMENSSFYSLASSNVFNSLLIELGLLLILISLFLKLALTPFHLWSPDIYEGSPSSSTFFFVVVSKISIFVFLLKICYLSFYSAIVNWQFYLLLVAVSSILLGSIAALKQRKIKSLLAYSSISNMGLILASFSAGNFEGIKAVFYYFVIYIISGLSIWSIFFALKLKKKNYGEKYNKDLGDFTLLHESNGVLAYAFVITIFTIAGIPPMVGFLAKLNIFLTLIISSMNLIAFISIIASVISTFYYIRILKVVFFENVLVGKLFYPINSKINIVRSFLFFLMIFLFINPSVMNFLSYKVTLFLSKSFY